MIFLYIYISCFVVSDSNANNWWWRVNLGKEYLVRIILVFADNCKTFNNYVECS